MKNPLPPVMNLDELKKDILDKGPAAALPCQLSDLWLDRVADSLEQVLEFPGARSSAYLAGPLALVIHILFSRSTSTELEISYTRIFECLQAYRVEVSLEAINRRSSIKTCSASLETIFTDRLLTSVRDQTRN